MEGLQLPSSPSTVNQQLSSPSSSSLLTEAFTFETSFNHNQHSIGDSIDQQSQHQHPELINQHEIKSSPEIWSNTQNNTNDNWSYYSPYIQFQDYLRDDSSNTRTNQTEQINLPVTSIDQSPDLNLSQPPITDHPLSSSPPATIQQLLSSSPTSLSTETYSLSTPMDNHFKSLSQDQQSTVDYNDNQLQPFETLKYRQDSNKQHNHSSAYHRWSNNPYPNSNGVWPCCSQYCQIHGGRTCPYYNPYMVCNRSGQVYYPPSPSLPPHPQSSSLQSAPTEFQLSDAPSLSSESFSHGSTSIDNPCPQQFNSIQSRQDSKSNEVYSPYHRWAPTNPHCLQYCQIHAAQHYPHYNPSIRCNRPTRQQQFYQPLQPLPEPVPLPAQMIHQHSLGMAFQGTSTDLQLASLSQNQPSPSSLKMATLLKKKKTTEKTIKKRKKCDN